MQDLSMTDGLTGVLLRRPALERLKEETVRAQRTGEPLSFLMIDVDHFKTFNDTYGHQGGDIVLKKAARVLKDFFSLPACVVGRYGGEEFCVVLARVTKQEALRLAESFRRSLGERELTLRKDRVKITVSVGLATFPDDASSHEDLVRLADEALLRAKRSGRNTVCPF
jgi:diguanylate cyclase (GGDEF)-like protein